MVLVIAGIEWWQSRHLPTGPLSETLRTQTIPTLEGGVSTLWQSEQTTLLYVFAPWCVVCKSSASNLNSFMNTDFNVVSLALSWENKEDIRKFVGNTGLETPVLVGNNSTADLLQISSFPSYFVIGKDGRILKAWSGYTTTAGLWLRAMLFR